ncbi:MAG: hypothetical protein MZV63_29340 [Marinilabiliales bacterium]|nr:hypothetical protein [Marinilabiliales bacterium]
MLYYFPYKYVDKTRFYTVRELDTDMQYVQLRSVINTTFSNEGGGCGKRLTADFHDETGYGQARMVQGTKVGIEYI